MIELARNRPAVLLTGERQTGKTSLLQHLFPQADYVSFDWPANADEVENNPPRIFVLIPRGSDFR